MNVAEKVVDPIYEVRVFAGRLKAAREHAGLTQRELGVALGWGIQRIGRYETAEYSPDLTDLVMLARKLNVSVGYLLGMSNNPSMDIDAYSPQEKALVDAARRGDGNAVMRIFMDTMNTTK